MISEWIDEHPEVNVERPDPRFRSTKDLFLFDFDVFTKIEDGWKRTKPPPPYPRTLSDPTWGGLDDKDKGKFVVMPFAFNDYQVPMIGRLRCELVREAIGSFARGVRELPHLVSGIRTYNTRVKMTLMEKLLRAGKTKGAEQKLLNLLTKIAQLAARMEELITQPIPLLHATSQYDSISLSQEQAACLLAHAFYCTFPPQNSSSLNINMNDIHSGNDDLALTKLQFILAYFDEVTSKMPPGTLSIKRTVFEDQATDKYFTGWANEGARLSDLITLDKGSIEDADGCLQVDFANKYIGGGVLRHGAVQEEIRFLICPELIISKLICPQMDPNSAITIIGAQRYSSYTGYGSSLCFEPFNGPEEDRDMVGRARVIVVAMDALQFSAYSAESSQYREGTIVRELKKATAAFWRTMDEPARPVATGNWGCGVFNGDVQLKSLIQLMAASKCGRPLVYFTFNEGKLAKELMQVYSALKKNNVPVGILFQWLRRYDDSAFDDVFQFVHSKCEAHRMMKLRRRNGGA